MSIFGRDEEPEAQPSPKPAARKPANPKKTRSSATVISSGTRIKGEITGATEIQVEGRVDGTLDIESVVSVSLAYR